MKWGTLEAPHGLTPPAPLKVRAQSIPARHSFPEHAHDWHQMVYAISGVLTVNTQAGSFMISPEQAAWLPTGLSHQVGSMFGAEFRSLWISDRIPSELPGDRPTLFDVSPLLKALIIEAARVEDEEDTEGYTRRITQLILDQLRRTTPLSTALPWPRNQALATLCEALYADPADPTEMDTWARRLGMSERTLARHFVSETGMSLRTWRRRLRLFRAIELLGDGLDVTRTALELGYGSTSAFIYAFRQELGSSPQAYMRGE
ncbi:AraC family transcriptional regulator [Pseudomonas sp. ICMP22404]|uniref:AraC family transcriptional regulator n=1 Tax=Pseudomonas TaxID=286 RepID=UPI00111BC60C|nr:MULTISPECIES: helix-turn-helix transcriptional regulator [Pseudomonas]MCI0994959.1 helix-turn-helix transcriptional regulator [Pseudomonas corrugata]NUT65713.1 helix-turn-helix transcriptional regulator [Pseudomonas corrugata]TNF84436.1 AraC family transcriptional regulator [Pseudomonas sp. ICMP22404]